MKSSTNLSAFSVHRAFVVQFRAESDVDQGKIVGRIEHLASRQRAPFQSWLEMQMFIAQILMQIREGAPDGCGNPDTGAGEGKEDDSC